MLPPYHSLPINYYDGSVDCVFPKYFYSFIFPVCRYDRAHPVLLQRCPCACRKYEPSNCALISLSSSFVPVLVMCLFLLSASVCAASPKREMRPSDFDVASGPRVNHSCDVAFVGAMKICGYGVVCHFECVSVRVCV